MTTEEQMYDEIMHKMPHRIIEFIKAIDYVSKMLERKGYGKLNDNLDQLKTAFEKAQKEQENIYSAVYDKAVYHTKNFEELLPQSFNELVDNFIGSGYIEEQAINEGEYFEDKSQVLSDCEPKDDPGIDFRQNCNDIAQNADFVHLCEHYFNEEEYEGNFSEYIDNSGHFDFDRFCEETDFKSDIMHDLQNTVLTNDKVYQHIEDVRKSYISEHGDIDDYINSFADDKTTTADKTAPVKFTDDFER